MIRPLKIGFLTPYSGVYPFYGQHLMAGILLGLFKDPLRQHDVQFVPAYTKMGDAKSSIEAVNRMVFFDQVDMISGLVSYKAIPDLIPVLENFNKLAFFFDMGEYIPYFNHLSPNIFYSSQQIWQSQFALGHWAHKEFGDTGMMVMPVYEAGYHLNSAFHKGANTAGSTRMGLHVIPRDPADIKRLNLDSFFTEIKKNTPAYVHAIFAGKMGNDFLNQWKQSEFSKNIPLTVVENMAYDDILEDTANLDLEMYAATSWSRTFENARNKEFVSKFETTGGQMANIYGLLGYEAGLALNAVKPQLEKRDWDTVKSLLRKESIVGPRGERNFYPLSGFSLPVVDILRVKTSLKKIYKTVVSQGNGLKFDSPDFKEIHDESISGWQNPYLCI
ncbi:amino acid/amide ABC transporter substrate-binding protein, HAAT family [Mucilaginibacter sp. OK268]|uniref:ABC transporter substrate-binding protein n=1 Tax=Mucilaginibacter sp. OK268 TaxID=1881048 RepID=UPI0008902125|nr:ABC transporter substrate-binding protein [Mucilaginibacter sp. OK268]SDP30096.1 amino acid/amide ABC transporter substrate-binding protein, HAAT family [Mucilaginibacter sp. OK268]